MIRGLVTIVGFALLHIHGTSADTNAEDEAAFTSLKKVWQNYPPNWGVKDPCGNSWEGITCNEDRIISIKLSSIGLVGRLIDDIKGFPELQILDLSYNTGLKGPLPRSIGSLSKLTSLILLGCSFSGDIPQEIGFLQNLRYLSLNSNYFSGTIPATIGNMSNLSWLDIANNSLTGEIPVSSSSTPGLDLLTNTKHFHFGKNQLTGQIPPQLFSSKMTFIQVLLDGNKLTGNIPSTLGSVKSLEVLRLDRNLLSGSAPSNLNNLKSVSKLYLSNKKLIGPFPNMTEMNRLNYLDLSNNSFDVTDFPPWLSTLQSLTTVLVSDLVCNKRGVTALYCQPRRQLGRFYSKTAENCVPITCPPDQDQSPKCQCSYPYAGTLYFRAPSFSDFGNSTHYQILEDALMKSFEANKILVDSVSLYNPKLDSDEYLEVSLEVYPIDLRFNRSDISAIAFILSNQTFKPPPEFGPYFFIGLQYSAFSGEVTQSSKSSANKGAIAGAAGGSVVFLVVIVFVIFALIRKRKANRSVEQNGPFANWKQSKGKTSAPHVKGPILFSYDDLKKSTKNFSESSEIGSGEYGKVYRGVLSDGRLVDIRRAQKGSMQGRQFKTEIELLSRVHHTNIVSLVGFCFGKNEQLLVFEHIPNGSLKESLSGKSVVRLDWRKRIKVALGAGRGLAYLHELADPPIVHRDMKSSNILLDDHLNAKVSNFGLSGPIGQDGKGNDTTQIKGTMEHVDPEYFTTLQFTDKSDVYSFGVLLLEIITAKEPIEGRRCIVRETRSSMDRTKDLYGLDKLIDPSIGLVTTLGGFEKYVDLAMSCVEESGADRPTMSAVVRELENIAQLAGINPYSESQSMSARYDVLSKDDSRQHPYDHTVASVDYSGAVYSLSEVEPK